MRWNIIQKYRIALRIYTVIKYHALIAQLDRASGYGPEGWEFESLWVHHKSIIRIVYLLQVSGSDLLFISVINRKNGL